MRFVFGEYGLDTKRRVLDGPSGEVALRPKVFALLELLIAERDRVVPKEELFERLWPSVYVGDATLNTCIKLARQAVGDSGELQAAIRTLHGHGYRFVATVEERDDDAPSPERPHMAATAPPIAPGLPELPSENLSGPVQRERKQVTVLDCAVNAAAVLARELGAEAMDEVMERFATTAEETVRRHGGTITQWHGDGFVALFGAPRALEDHAVRAVAAALALRDGVETDIVVGLHTGTVVVGPTADDPARVFTAIGETTETARNLRLSAAANAVVASQETYAIVRDDVTAKLGLEGTETSHVIEALAAPRPGPKGQGRRVLARFVGRERELALLRDRLETAAAGDGQIVGVLGEPGIGKSRLVDEFARGAAAAQIRVFRGQCLAYAANSPFFPIRDLVLGFCGAEATDAIEALADKVAVLLEEAGIAEPEAYALLRQVLGLRASHEQPLPLSPEERRRRTQGLLYALAAHISKSGPSVIIVEDIHWIDATSEAWLSGLVTRLPGMRMILVVTARTGYHAPWLARSSVSQIALARLRSEESAALVGSLSTIEPIGGDELKRIVDRAQGNPFFLEELTLNAAAANEISVPETVQAVLTARIDQLAATDKHLLQVAAVIGTEVPIALLGRIDDLEEPERQSSLERLQAAGFLRESGTANERRVAFKHALTQDVAYLGLIGRARAAIHQRVAAAMEAELAGLAREQPELLAHHLTESGDTERAIVYWRQAGRRASERSSEREAIAHFETALSLAEDLPEAASSARRRLALLLDLGVALQNVSGQGATDVGRVYQRANDLAAEVGEIRLSFEALWGLWTHRLNRGGFETAQMLATQLLAIAHGMGEAETMLQARHAAWTTARFRGELAEALEQSARGIDLHPENSAPPLFYAFGGHDPIVCARGARAIALWLSGRAEHSARELADALSTAERLEHPGTMANALVNAADLFLMKRDRSALEKVAGRLLELAAAYGFDQPNAVGHFALGWCLCQDSDIDAGIAKMEEGLQAMKDLGRTYQELYYVALVAEAAISGGDVAPALDRLGQVLEGFADVGVGHWAEGEAYRINGEAVFATAGDVTRAEELMRKALAVSRKQGALALELRAVTSLGRLMIKNGRAAEARTMVDAVRARFAEGLDSADFALASALTLGPEMQPR